MPPRKEAKIQGRAGAPRPAPSRAPAESTASPNRAPSAAALLGPAAAVLASLLYLPTLKYGWIWNDSVLTDSVGRTIQTGDGQSPVLQFLTRAEWLIGSGQPALYHATSLLLYAAVTWLVFLTARQLGARPWLSFGAAVLFGALPVHAEAVAYVSGRSDLLATALALGAVAIARGRSTSARGVSEAWRVWSATGLATLAVFSNEVALAAPFVLVALDRWSAPRAPAGDRRPYYAGFFLAALAGVLARVARGSLGAASSHEGIPAGAAWTAPFHATVEYLRLLILPTIPNVIRSFRPGDASAIGPVVGALVAVACVIAYAVRRPRDPLARAGAIFFLLPLLPALPLPFFQGAYVEERAVTFASVGLVLLAASLASWIASALPGARRYAPALLLAAAAAGAVGTRARIPAWRDNISLLQAATKAAPRDPEAYYMLAQSHEAIGEDDAALVAVDRSIAIDSTAVDPHHLRAVLLSRKGDFAGAEREARRSIALEPGDGVAWANLGNALTREGRLPEALDACRRAVKLDSTLADSWYNLGVTLGASGDLPGATEAYRRTIAIDPRHVQAVNNLGTALASQGRIEEARDAYLRAIALSPTSVETRMNLALAYLRLGDVERASRERDIIRGANPALGHQLDELIRAQGGPAPAR